MRSAKVTNFKPASIQTQRTDLDDASKAAGFAAGWAAGARAAAEAAQGDRDRVVADHKAREAERDVALAQSLNALAQARQQWIQRALPVLEEERRTVYAAALDLAEAVLQREIRPSQESARTLLGRALKLPADAGPATVRLHPDDLMHVNLLIASGETTVPDGLRLVADSRLRQGDALTEYEDGALDARISTALARAREILLGEES